MLKPDEAIKLLTALADDLIKIVKDATDNGDFEVAGERLKRWKRRAINELEQKISNIEAENLREKRKGSFIMGEPHTNLADEVDMYRGFILSLAEEIKDHPEDVFISKVSPNFSKEETASEVRSNKNRAPVVFIIHGHDQLSLLQLKDLLREKWHLEVIVLKDEPNSGRTIIEKFLEEAQRATYSFALFTPDDFINKDKSKYFQSRPNTIFELGWFYGRLGRDHVCIISKNGTNIPSDLAGIVRVDFNQDINEKVSQIESELKKADVIS